MRINVYDHDQTGNVEHVTKVTEDSKGTKKEQRFSGIRFWLNPKIIHTHIGNYVDDDTPAITFWHHEDDAGERNRLITALAKALRPLGVSELPPAEDYAEEKIMKMEVKHSLANPDAPSESN